MSAVLLLLREPLPWPGQLITLQWSTKHIYTQAYTAPVAAFQRFMHSQFDCALATAQQMPSMQVRSDNP